ncbi:PilZ domain-containing protein [Spirochaeta lutea]|uniref:PilZ domain-containing protein n=1 Tax=Spirochaeta lutea TaxID=1480694 RepID=A0A098QVJ6_9SPIO|nr:PilZ domain-containing protein [Spirochaeta lutea]KGE71413.1 hypothetical protein DC28_11505 [Spirochaeta lutea]
MNTETERRRAPRYRLHQLVHLDMGREDFIPADGLNISTTGLACLTDLAQDVGSRMFTMFQLDPSSEESLVKCEGIVSRCDAKPNGEFEIGVEFTDILESDKRKIEEYLTQA